MPSIKYKDSTTGNMLPVSVKVGDTLPVGTEIDYDGESVPLGWEQVADGDLIVSPTEPSGNDRRKVWLRHTKNLSNGINQGYYLNNACNLAGTSTSDNGLVIDVSNLANVTVSTSISQTRYRVACISALPSGSGVTAYNGVNKDGTSDTITIDTENYSYLVVNATDLTKIQVEAGTTATPYTSYVTDKTYILNDNNIYEEFINNEPVVLWKNPSRTAIFSNQTITLNDSLTNYKFYEIIFNRTNGDYTISTGRIPTDRNTMLQIFRAYGFIRGVEIASNTTLAIGEATRYDSYGGSNTSINNNYCIPEQILGYK